MDDTAALQVDIQDHCGVCMVRMAGRLDSSSYSRMWDILHCCAEPAPRAIVVDVKALEVPSAAPLSVFAVVRLSVARWPGVPILLAGAEQPLRAMLDNSVVQRFVPSYPTTDQALDSVGDPPPRRRVQLRLPLDDGVTRWVGQFAANVCLSWQLKSVPRTVALVAARLVSEARRASDRCGDDTRLLLELCEDMLTIAIRIDNPYLPLVGRSSLRNYCQLAMLTPSWGHLPTGTGGKIVWATISCRMTRNNA